MLIVVLLQMSLGFLDLVAIAFVGALGALSVTGIQSSTPGNRVSKILQVLQIENLAFQKQVIVLGSLASVFLLTRTLLSVYFSRKIIFFLGNRGAKITSNLLTSLLREPLLLIQSQTTQQTIYALTAGVHSITIGVISAVIMLVVDLFLLMILLAGLIVVNATLAVSTIFIFFTASFSIYYLQTNRARKLGKEYAEFNIKSEEKMYQVLTSYRELSVKNRREYFALEISKLRKSIANAQSELSFMPQVSKYVFESTLVIGGLIICGIQFAFLNSSNAIATLSVFLVVGSRVAPALIRIQQGLMMIRSSIGSAQPTLDLLNKVDLSRSEITKLSKFAKVHSSFKPKIEISNLNFSYPGLDKFAINDLSLIVEENEFVAIVGSSGAGKTTLVDILLGVLNSEEGKVLISGIAPSAAISKWPGGTAYLPQDSNISNGTVRENVTLGFAPNEISDQDIWDALEFAQISNFINNLPYGLDTNVGDRGTRLSGGQKQRLGIARTMITKPKLLVLDEATSALDAETESAITEALKNLKGKLTMIVIAHRLSTIKDADRIIFMRNGEIAGVGTFDLLKLQIPDFAMQAKIMGL